MRKIKCPICKERSSTTIRPHASYSFYRRKIQYLLVNCENCGSPFLIEMKVIRGIKLT